MLSTAEEIEQALKIWNNDVFGDLRNRVDEVKNNNIHIKNQIATRCFFEELFQVKSFTNFELDVHL